jgi:DNA (cytosine-5)-methyltransferase 1
MKYLSVCSGIEAATVAWYHLGWEPVAFAEIEPFPSGQGGGDKPHVLATAFAQNQRDEVRTMDIAGALAAEPGMKQQTYLQQAMQVRRLTPVECERLQGFPDNYTLIPWRKKPASDCPDGPRYKALGNSWAVPVVKWIGERINGHVDA